MLAEGMRLCARCLLASPVSPCRERGPSRGLRRTSLVPSLHSPHHPRRSLSSASPRLSHRPAPAVARVRAPHRASFREAASACRLVRHPCAKLGCDWRMPEAAIATVAPHPPELLRRQQDNAIREQRGRGCRDALFSRCERLGSRPLTQAPAPPPLFVDSVPSSPGRFPSFTAPWFLLI